VEQGLAGEWVAGPSRLAITWDGTAFSAVYRFPDPGPFSREGHQTMKGELLPDNDLRLTNINHGKLANPLDYFSGDFDGVSLVSLSSDGTFLTARLDDGRSLVLTRVVGDPDPDSTGVESPEQQRESSEASDLQTNEEIDLSTENISVRDDGPGVARSPSRLRTAPERHPSGLADEAWRRGSTPERLPRRVGGSVEAPVLVTRTEPRYTEVARKARISGIVILECVIDENGSVRDVRVLKPLPFGLDRAAADAVKQWTFRPGMLNGQPVEVVYNLTVTFKLN
jgi:TonB family protein